MTTLRCAIALASQLALGASAHAGYYATGPYEGTECSGVVIKACSKVSVDAVEGSDGRLYDVTRHHQSVSSYSPARGSCSINLKSGGIGVSDLIRNKVKQPKFYTRSGGDFKRVDVDYITFTCRPD